MLFISDLHYTPEMVLPPISSTSLWLNWLEIQDMLSFVDHGNVGDARNDQKVTFRDPEAARRACFNPNPVIDGRRANCNLAALGRPRPRPPPHYGHLRAIPSHIASLQSPRGAYVGSPTYHQPVTYSQQVFTYPPYGYTAYGPEYIYPQGAYNPYIAQQYLQMYGVPSLVNSAMYPFGQMRQPLSGNQGYTAVHGYTMPAHRVVQFSGFNNGLSAAHIPSMQGPYSAG